MQLTVQKVSIEELAVGMYVSQLDRPWLETPFLFQGFTIKSAKEIDALKRYCKFVYVDESESQPGRRALHSPIGDLPATMPGSAGRGLFARVIRWLRGDRALSQPGEFYRDSVTLKTELPKARDIHSQASSALSDAMGRVREGGKLDVRAIETVVSPMIESVLRNRDAMTWLSRIKQIDDYTYGHSVSCSVYAVAFGRHLGLPKQDLEVLGLGGMLLDVGKTCLPKTLLQKQDELTDEERALMREHVRFGLKILRRAPNMDERVLTMVRSHHERYDGSGYPDGLRGPDIPVFARIAGIVDFFDALITPRPYAPPVSEYDAMRELHKRASAEFQTEMVDQFVQAIGMFPNGALVELSTGEVGIVVEQNRVRRLRPKITVILDADKRPLEKPITIDLRKRPAEMGESGAIWIDRGVELGAYDIDPAEYFL